MLSSLLLRLRLRGWMFHGLSTTSIGLCLLLWQRAKTVDQDERGNAERRALFVGLWPPTLWLVGDTLERAAAASAPRRRLRPWSR
jgi:hypothetical protein